MKLAMDKPTSRTHSVLQVLNNYSQFAQLYKGSVKLTYIPSTETVYKQNMNGLYLASNKIKISQET